MAEVFVPAPVRVAQAVPVAAPQPSASHRHPLPSLPVAPAAAVVAAAFGAQSQRASRKRVAMKQVPLRTECAPVMPHAELRAGVKETTVVKSIEEANRVLAILRQHKDRFHAIDTEVRGWEKGTTPYGHGEVMVMTIFCGDDVDFGTGAQLFVDNMDEDGNLRGLIEHFRSYLEDPDIPKVFQNYSFDRAILLNHGCRVAGFAADTMHMARLINSDEEKVSLEALGAKYLSSMWRKQSLQDFMKKEKASDCQDLHNHTDPHVRNAWVDYSAFDAQVTWKLHEVFCKMLQMQQVEVAQRGTLLDFYDRFWRPFAEVLVDIEERGVYTDQAFLKAQKQEADKDLEKAEKDFRDFLREQWQRDYPEDPELMDSAEQFNLNSPKQMKQLLYGTGVKTIAKVRIGGFGLMPVNVGKQKESTGAEAIKKLAGDCPSEGICGKAFDKLGRKGCMGLYSRVEANKIQKNINSFLVKLSDPDIVDEDGRLHTSLYYLARTGRLTCRNPNLQQIPAVDKDRYQIRNAFVPAPGNSFVIADYGQLDLRVLAHTSGCPDLIQAVRSGIDLHSHTAAQMYPKIQAEIDSGELSLEGGDGERCVKDVYPSERRSAKAVNFGIAYGLTAHGLSIQLSCPKEEAQDMIDKWYQAYAQVEAWQSEVIQEAEIADMTVRTYRGRPRHIPDLMKKPKGNNKKNLYLRQYQDKTFWEYLSAKRQAINAPVQGGSADVVVEAMVKASEDEELLRLGYRMILQVHDELIFEGPEEHAEEALAAVRRVMEHPFLDDYEFKVPLVVDAKVATSWHEAKHA